MNLTRRTLVTTVALSPLACGVPLSYEMGIPVVAPNPPTKIRPPEVGQEWVYIKRDAFDGKILDVITENISQISTNIVITRLSQGGEILPNEIQSSWGMVVVDPQWPRLLNFNPPLALWPQDLSVGWSKQFITKYSIAGYPDSRLNWQEYMSVVGWEKITVPAGTFTALRFHNLISYENSDPTMVNCVRKETLWFSPEIGRWVARETSGTFHIQGEIGNENLEDSYQWQLISYK